MSPAAERDDNIAVVSRRRRGGGQYRCKYCIKVFKRSEHCVRHERTHTSEKPFSCRYCHKSYARKDLVTRHERTLHAEQHAEVLSRAHNSRPEIITKTLVGPSAAADTSGEQGQDPVSENLASPVSARSSRHSSDDVESDSATTVSESQSVTEDLFLVDEPAPDLNRHLPECTMEDAPQFTTVMMRPLDDFWDYDPATLDQVDMFGPVAVETAQEPTPNQVNNDSQLLSAEQQQTAQNLPSDIPPLAFSPSLGLGSGPTSAYGVLYNQTGPDLDLSMWVGSAPPQTLGQHQVHSSNSKEQSYSIPNALRDNLTISGNHGPSPAFSPCLDGDTFTYLCADLAERLEVRDVSRELPNARICQGFLSSYVECFHGHLPIIHWPTLSLSTTPSPLVLAICSIGALYRLDRRRARNLYDIAIRALAPTLGPQSLITKKDDYPLWAVQAKLLLSYFASLSGDQELASAIMGENAMYTLIYGQRKKILAKESCEIARLDWSSWACRESWKRVLGAMYVLSTLFTIIYDVTPSFNVTQDLAIEVYQETLWNVKTATDWSQLRMMGPSQDSLTLKDVLEDIMAGNNRRHGLEAAPYQVSPFSALVLMHAMIVHTWHVMQVARTYIQMSPTSGPSYDSLGLIILDSEWRRISRCDKLLKSGQEGPNGGLEDEVASLVFSSKAILRVALTRLCGAGSAFNRLALLTPDPDALEAAICSFADADMQRSPQLLRAIATSIEGLSIPIKMGHMVIRKTAAFRWSFEQGAAYWDITLFVTRWVHLLEIKELRGTELTPDEKELMTTLRDLLQEVDYDTGSGESLAAGLAQTFAWFLKDVWVWSITPRMGAVLEQLGTAYERAHSTNRRQFSLSACAEACL